MTRLRSEEDFLGKLDVPADRYFGIETQRAVTNFPITGIPISSMPELLSAFAWIKSAAATVNRKAGDLSASKAEAISQVCLEICDGELSDHFPVDVVQGGAGTSTNMNVNEVIANRGLEIMGRSRGDYAFLHPKDDVNRCQSTNDVYATAARLALVQVNRALIAELRVCAAAFGERALQFADVPKLGRTQLQDAVRMSVGQELAGFAETLSEDVERLGEIEKHLLDICLGGTAIGTGIGVSDYYEKNIVGVLREVSGFPVVQTRNRIEATWDTGVFVLYSGLLKRLATKLGKIANDLRLLSSGPAGGLGELRLPAVQPGSSIMPGKVNPVIPEVVNQTCYRVFGADTTVTFAAEAGQLQLNAMGPVIVWTLYDATSCLTSAVRTLVENCIDGIAVDRERCRATLASSSARATLLAEDVGYNAAASVAMNMTEHRMTFEDALRRELPGRAADLLRDPRYLD